MHRGLIKSLTLHTGAAAVTSNHEFQITIPDHSMINLNFNNLDRNIRPSQRSAEILIISPLSLLMVSTAPAHRNRTNFVVRFHHCSRHARHAQTTTFFLFTLVPETSDNFSTSLVSFAGC
jgi:hypothetical protein